MPEHQLHVREVALRAATDTDKREFTGLAVPWNEPVAIRDWFGEYTEEFERGAVQDSDHALVFWRHDEPIGRITSARDTTAGWEITGVLSQTPRGDEAYTLLRDGVIDRMSIGFDFREYREEHDVESDEMHLIHTKVLVREVSLVPFPAYDGAKVATVRSATTSKEKTPVTDTLTRADLAEVNETVTELTRSIEFIKANIGTPEPADVTGFRSYGEYVKALATGDEKAKRAYEGAVSGDAILKDAWIGDVIEIIKQKQHVASLFASGSLPAQGMTVEYGKLESDTTQVGVQENEGDDLLFGKVAITTDNAPVKTLGGWSSLSRQAIERTNVGILDTLFTALAEKYGRAIELLVRQALTGALAATDSDALAEVEADLTTQDGIVELVLDLVEHFDATGRSLDGILLDKASFLALYAVPATDRVLQVAGAPTDKVGTITIKTGDANVSGLRFGLLPNVAAGTVAAYDKKAIKTLESPGAPLRLQDENIVNLSKNFSFYGYASSFVQVPEGLVKVVPA